MNSTYVRSVLSFALIVPALASGQAMLRAAPSGRGTSEVVLAYPPAATPKATTDAAAMTTPPAAAPVPGRLAIQLNYGQPHLRGRTLHTDSLLPFGKPWRLGANLSTTLTTDVGLMLGGASIPRGKYVLFTVPGRTSWTLIVQRSVGQDPLAYADSNDVARTELQHTILASAIESLTMWLIPSLEPGPARGELRFAWGTDQLTVPWVVKQ